MILTKCESLTHPHKFGEFYTLRILTLNNFGCYYRRKKDLMKAYKYFMVKIFYLSLFFPFHYYYHFLLSEGKRRRRRKKSFISSNS